MKKILSLALALILIATAAVGCGKQSTETSDASASKSVSSQASSSEKSAFPVTVTDQMGNQVTLKEPAKRIVSGYYISSSTCIALGLKDKLVATEEKIDQRPIYKYAAPELIGKVGNVGSAKAFDLEACTAAKPDLVILPKKAKDYAKTLTGMGIATIVVNPESHQELEEMIRLISKLTDTEKQADKLLARYKKVMNKVNQLTSDVKDTDKPVVYMCGPSSYMTTAPKDMYQSSLIETAGGKNAGDALEGDNWVNVSYEQILKMNPDVIVIPTNNMANGQPDYSAKDVLADKNLAGVTAVKNGAVYNMPAGYEAWDSPVPSGVLGMLWMTATLYPEKYSMKEFAKDASNFYKTFYGFDMDTSALTK